jgi:hypothetical protein|tara:strand:+ start:1376 stop:1873 length:498 start_codon:yes stop_codon:yes gene_type:complete
MHKGGKMQIKAKPILKNKFWIIESGGERIGTLSKQEDKRYMYSCATGTEYFADTKSFNSFIGGVSWDKASITDGTILNKEIHGFSTSTTPYNVMYNVQKKLPLFTKSKKSKSLYCAGYYIIRFDKGWVRSFCPKLVTLEKYPFKGPFKTEFTMRQELSDANKRSD